jgi:hypothetical protein
MDQAFWHSSNVSYSDLGGTTFESKLGIYYSENIHALNKMVTCFKLGHSLHIISDSVFTVNYLVFSSVLSNLIS